MVIPTHCELCPRRCGADRVKHPGRCGAGGQLRVARAALHFWEEPCISGKRGSGTVFFTGCSLGCCYCQNYAISQQGLGKAIDETRLADIFLELQAKGAANLNLVTATQWLPWVTAALDSARGLRLPVVWNTGGYETTETVAALKGYVDVWLPDLKYSDSALSAKYSRASDYPEVALRAIDSMVKFAGAPVIENGLIKRGVIVRYLVLPGYRHDGEAVLRTIAERWGGKILLSLMRQFTPDFASPDCDLKRRVTSFEYNSLLSLALSLGLDGYFQDASSAVASFTPNF